LKGKDEGQPSQDGSPSQIGKKQPIHPLFQKRRFQADSDDEEENDDELIDLDYDTTKKVSHIRFHNTKTLIDEYEIRRRRKERNSFIINTLEKSPLRGRYHRSHPLVEYSQTSRVWAKRYK